MLEEVGSVVELQSKQTAIVLCQKSSMCAHCAAAGLCRIGDDSRTMLVEALNYLGAKVGDRVRLATSTRTFLQSSFVLYIVPIIGLLIGAISGQLIGTYLVTGVDPNLLAALIGFSFLAGTFLLIKVGSRAIPKEQYMPRIVAILEEDGTDAGDGN